MRRRLSQLRRAILATTQLAADASEESQAPLTAARQFAFLYLVEQGSATAPEVSLEAALARSRAEGRDRFYSETVAPRCVELLGKTSPQPPVPDEQFDRWLNLFRVWTWSLSEADGAKCATPELLGALCEFSLDQKAHGAYFTSSDVTTYICENVLLPALLDAVPEFTPPAGVDRYLWKANLQPGLLPLETDYECAARRIRVERCRLAWAAGDIRIPDDWITWNLNLALAVKDWIGTTHDLAALGRLQNALRGLRVLDPTCGSGAFLIAALETLLPLHLACRERLGSTSGAEAEVVASIVRHNLYGIDRAPEAVETCRMRLLLRIAAAGRLGPVAANVRRGDVLFDHLFPEVRATGGFDAVLGNPPYVACAVGSGNVERGFRTASCGNLYALVTERATQLSSDTGRMGMILPVSSISLPGFRLLADILQRGRTWVSSYSNRPAKLFPGVEQRLAIWITGPADTPGVFASSYQHWYAEERPHLFSRLCHHPASKWAATGMPIKTGCPEAEAIFGKLIAQGARLKDWEAASVSGGAVWLHDGPTYWVRALAFEPNPETPREDGHYHRIEVAEERIALVLSAVLCSTTFYFFFKLISNCRDLGRKEWEAFPCDPLAPVDLRELEALGRELQKDLQTTARRRSRHYPSGAVEYWEYYPAKAKAVLDAIDRVLARHYGFSALELEYLLNYDLKYRMGQHNVG